MNTITLDQPLTLQVKNFYKKYTYPNYPLFFRPYVSDGYLGTSLFAAHLANAHGYSHTALQSSKKQFGHANILTAGCGEILPYILRSLEPWKHHMTFLDLSQESLKRARWRLLFNPKNKKFVCQSIEESITHSQLFNYYDHIDAFGVLHHLADPKWVIQGLSSKLREGGTLRVMIYNSSARKWIHALQNLFRLAKINPMQESDLVFVQNFLNDLSEISPYYQKKLDQLGQSTLKNHARLADTFLHVREIRRTPQKWLSWFQEAGFEWLGAFDRYGEMDHLENPFLKNPNLSELNFSGNCEWYFVLNPKQKNISSPKTSHLISFQKLQPPYMWNYYDELKHLSHFQKIKLWSRYLDSIHGIYHSPLSKNHCEELGKKAIGRLSRLGILFPKDIPQSYSYACVDKIGDISKNDTTHEINQEKLKNIVCKLFQLKNCYHDKKIDLSVLRIIKSAQK